MEVVPPVPSRGSRGIAMFDGNCCAVITNNLNKKTTSPCLLENRHVRKMRHTGKIKYVHGVPRTLKFTGSDMGKYTKEARLPLVYVHDVCKQKSLKYIHLFALVGLVQ